MNNECNYILNTPQGIILTVKLVPNSSSNKIVDYNGEYIRIKISAPAIENRANKELIQFCSEVFNINKSKIKIVSGEKSKLKKVLFSDCISDDITKKLLFVLDSIHKDNK